MATMTVKDFVRNSLTEILKGIVEAQKDSDVGEFVAKGAIGGLSFPSNSGVVHEARLTATTVKFDVAVTVESSGEGGASAGFDIGVARGDLGGDIAERKENISRIQFAVPLLLPKSEDTRESEDTRGS